MSNQNTISHSDFRLGYSPGDKFICRICGETDVIRDSEGVNEAMAELRKFGIELGLPTVCESCDRILKTPRRTYGNGQMQELPPIALDALIEQKRGLTHRRPPLVVPEEFQGLMDTDISLLPDRAAFDKVQAWRMGKKGMAIHGASGSAKTRSILVLYARLWQEGVEALIVDAGRWTNQVAEKFRDGWGHWFMEKLIVVPVLMIDDIGSESKGERGEGSMFAVIKRRIDSGKPVIFTGQRSGAELIENSLNKKRTMAMVRRMRESCTDIAFRKPKEITPTPPAEDKPK